MWATFAAEISPGLTYLIAAGPLADSERQLGQAWASALESWNSFKGRDWELLLMADFGGLQVAHDVLEKIRPNDSILAFDVSFPEGNCSLFC